MPKEPETISARASRIVSDRLKKIMKAGCLRQARYDYLISDDIQESILAVSRYQSTKLFWPLSGLTALCFRLKACGHVSASPLKEACPYILLEKADFAQSLLSAHRPCGPAVI